MLAPLALALSLAQDPAPAQVAPPKIELVGPFVVSEPSRIRLTPKLDGTLSPEEWDPLADSPEGKTFFQWAPGRLFFAATSTGGRELIASIDLKGDGWLVGKDNVEVRLTPREGGVGISARLLDATNRSGPVWRDLPLLALATTAAATSTADGTTIEASIGDAGLDLVPQGTGRIAVRADVVPSTGAPPTEPFLPRPLALVELVETRAAALPTGLEWNVENNNRPVVPGERTRIRLTFRGKEPVRPRQVEMRTEGLARDQASAVTTPFPPFDRKGRAFVDYETTIAPTAEVGYRLLRATVIGADGVPGVIEASYRIAPIVDLDVVRRPLASSDRDRVVTVPFYVQSNFPRRVTGEIAIQAPSGCRVLNGDERQRLVMMDAYSRIRKTFALLIPANASGPVPIDFSVTANGRKVALRKLLGVGRRRK